MARSGTQSSWEWFGRHDPYFGVVSHPRFRGAGRSGEAREEFFGSGEAHVGRVIAQLHDLFPDFAPVRALDFGCGVGRLALPLAKRIGAVVGIDVSPSMVEEARRNAAERGITNVEWIVSSNALDGVQGEFDLVHSFIVFQHIPVRRGLAILRALLDRLAVGGVAVLQLTYLDTNPPWRRALRQLRRSVPGLHRALERVRGRPAEPLMQMNSYPLNAVFAALEERGCGRVGVRFSDHSGHWGVLIFARRMSEPLY